MLILDSFCLLVSGETIRDKGMWKRFRIWTFRGPCTMRLDILCGSMWTSPQTVLKMWRLKLAGIHRTLWVDLEQSRGAGASLCQAVDYEGLPPACSYSAPTNDQNILERSGITKRGLSQARE